MNKMLFVLAVLLAAVSFVGCAAKYPLIVPSPSESADELMKKGNDASHPCSATLWFMKALEIGVKIEGIPNLNKVVTDCAMVLPPAKVAQEKEVK